MIIKCCICHKENQHRTMIPLSFAIPKKGQYFVLEYKVRMVCSQECAAKLRDQRGEVYD